MIKSIKNLSKKSKILLLLMFFPGNDGVQIRGGAEGIYWGSYKRFSWRNFDPTRVAEF